jgi:hypothetical protein
MPAVTYLASFDAELSTLEPRTVSNQIDIAGIRRPPPPSEQTALQSECDYDWREVLRAYERRAAYIF